MIAVLGYSQPVGLSETETSRHFRIIDVATAEVLLNIDHKLCSDEVVWTSDQRKLISSGENGHICVWDMSVLAN